MRERRGDYGRFDRMILRAFVADGERRAFAALIGTAIQPGWPWFCDGRSWRSTARVQNGDPRARKRRQRRIDGRQGPGRPLQFGCALRRLRADGTDRRLRYRRAGGEQRFESVGEACAGGTGRWSFRGINRAGQDQTARSLHGLCCGHRHAGEKEQLTCQSCTARC